MSDSSDDDQPRVIRSWGNLGGLFKMIAYTVGGFGFIFWICWLNGEAVDAFFEPIRDNCGPFQTNYVREFQKVMRQYRMENIRHVGKRKFPRFVDKPLPPPAEQEGCEIVEKNEFPGLDNGLTCEFDVHCRGARRCSCFGWCEGHDNCPEKAIPGTKRAYRNRNRVFLS